MPWQQREARRVGAARAERLRDEYGPFPWWDADLLAELLDDEGLEPVEVAEVFRVDKETVYSWMRRHRDPSRTGEAQAR